MRVEEVLSKDLWVAVSSYLPSGDSCALKCVARGEGWQGDVLLRALTVDGTCRVWKTPTSLEWEFGLPVAWELHVSPIKDFALTNDGHWLIMVASDGNVSMFNLRTGSRGPFTSRGAAKLAAWAANEKRRLDDAAIAEDERERQLRAIEWEVVIQTQVQKVNNVKAVAISQPDGRVLAFIRMRTLEVWRGSDDGGGEKYQRIVEANIADSVLYGVALSASGQIVGVADTSGFLVMDLERENTKKLRRVFTLAPELLSELWREPFGSWTARPVAWSPRDSTVVVGAWSAILVDAATGTQLQVLNHRRSPVVAVGFSPDGSRVATTTEDHAGFVWDVKTGRCQLSLPGSYGYFRQDVHDGEYRRSGWCSYKAVKIYFSLDGKLIVTFMTDGTSQLFDAGNGALLRSYTHRRGPRPPSIFWHLRHLGPRSLRRRLRTFVSPPRFDVPWTASRLAHRALVVVLTTNADNFLFICNFVLVVTVYCAVVLVFFPSIVSRYYDILLYHTEHAVDPGNESLPAPSLASNCRAALHFVLGYFLIWQLLKRILDPIAYRMGIRLTYSSWDYRG